MRAIMLLLGLRRNRHVFNRNAVAPLHRRNAAWHSRNKNSLALRDCLWFRNFVRKPESWDLFHKAGATALRLNPLKHPFPQGSQGGNPGLEVATALRLCRTKSFAHLTMLANFFNLAVTFRSAR